MKTLHINKMTQITGLAVGMAAMVSMGPEISAQHYTFKGGASKLMTPPSGVVIPSDAKEMACPKCITEWVERPILATKAMEPKTPLVARHLCNSCEASFATVGHGKQARDVATHKCGSCSADTLACCSTKKGDVTATKGMEKKFEVAPVK